MVDALEWIMLQASVDDRLRGRVLGAWNVAIGFGWIGPLLLGAIADATEVRLAFVIAGGVLGAVALVAAAASPRLRAA
jgi:sugar phosphate permease